MKIKVLSTNIPNKSNLKSGAVQAQLVTNYLKKKKIDFASVAELHRAARDSFKQRTDIKHRRARLNNKNPALGTSTLFSKDWRVLESHNLAYNPRMPKTWPRGLNTLKLVLKHKKTKQVITVYSTHLPPYYLATNTKWWEMLNGIFEDIAKLDPQMPWIVVGDLNRTKDVLERYLNAARDKYGVRGQIAGFSTVDGILCSRHFTVGTPFRWKRGYRYKVSDHYAAAGARLKLNNLKSRVGTL